MMTPIEKENNTPTPEVSTRRKSLVLLTKGFRWFFFLALIFCAFILFLTLTNPGAKVLAQFIEQLSQGQLQIHGVEGSLVHDLQIEELNWTDGETSVRIQRLNADIELSSLLKKTIAARQMKAASLDVSYLSEASSSSGLPTDLRLPVELQFPWVSLGQLRVFSVEKNKATTLITQLRALQGGLSTSADHYDAKMQFQSDFGVLNAKMQLSNKAPFIVAGKMAYDGQAQKESPAIHLDADVSGFLNDLHIFS